MAFKGVVYRNLQVQSSNLNKLRGTSVLMLQPTPAQLLADVNVDAEGFDDADLDWDGDRESKSEIHHESLSVSILISTDARYLSTLHVSN